MPMRRLICSFALSLAAVSAHAQSLDDVLATVNGTEITLGELLIARAQLPQQFQQMPEDALFEGLLNQVVQQQLLADSLEAEPLRLQLAIRSETRAMKSGEALLALTEGKIDEEMIQQAYADKYPPEDMGDEFKARHILLETEAEAEAVVAELEAGADFAELARSKSTGPSGPSGGDLGWFGLGVMVPAFEEAVVALEPDAISAPVQTQFGWHVIWLEDVRSKEAPALEDVRGQIEDELGAALIEAHLQNLQAGAKIVKTPDLDPSIIGRMELLELK